MVLLVVQLVALVMVLLVSPVVLVMVDHHHMNHHHHSVHPLVVTYPVDMVLLDLAVLAMVLLVLVMVLLVSPVVLVMVDHHHTNHHQHSAHPLVVTYPVDMVLLVSPVVLVMVLLAVILVELAMEDQAHKQLLFNNTQLMLKVSSKIQTHKSSVAQHQVVYKPIHKTSKFDSFNHHPSHPQAHSSSKKCAHLNHHHHHLFVFVNKLPLFLNPLLLSYVNVHQ
jgi:hypothetical protein